MKKSKTEIETLVEEIREEIERRKRFDEAAVVWSGVVASALLADIYLVARGKRSLTACVRDERYIALGFLVVFALHVAGKLGRYDPFKVIGALADTYH